MRNGRIDKGQKFSLGFWSVIQNLLGNISKAQHELGVGLVLKLFVLYLAFLKLEKFEFWYEFFVYSFEALQALDQKVDVLVIIFIYFG